MKLCFIDFEYNKSYERKLNLVSTSFALGDLSKLGKATTIWLHKNLSSQRDLKAHLESLRDSGYIFVAFNVVAEGRCFSTLGIDPIRCKWIDLWVLYRMLLNHNSRICLGPHSFKGKIKTVKRFVHPNRKSRGKETDAKPEDGLGAAVFKMLGESIDNKFKKAMRDLIISEPNKFEEVEKEQILAYNESDIVYLQPMLKAMLSEVQYLLRKHDIYRKNFLKEFIKLSEYSARTAIMEEVGYPFDYSKTKSLSKAIPYIMADICREINELFPDVKPFYWNKKEKRYSWNQKKTRDWIKEQGFRRWDLTGGGKSGTRQLSLSLDAFKTHFPYSHHYPKDSLGAQFVRFLSLKQQLGGFSTSGKTSFWDSVGSDGRVRPFFNIFKAQSARSQPSSTSFIFLKSAWQRTMVQPPKGRAICGIDFKSQEFLLGALRSRDPNMLNAYRSGDPYLYTGKLAHAAPWDATRKTHELVRQKFKSTTLSLQYGQTKYGLSDKLTDDTGIRHSTGEAQKLINLFERVYKIYVRDKKMNLRKYRKDGFIRLPDGWYMWGDNPNDRSVLNCPIQGLGSVIMRRAVEYAQDAGLMVIKTLHDALYIEFDVDDLKESIRTFADCMQRAFQDVVKTKEKIGLDVNVWGPDLKDETLKLDELKIKCQTQYKDDRGADEYEKFSQYFEFTEL
jgi:hypothetical protein